MLLFCTLPDAGRQNFLIKLLAEGTDRHSLWLQEPSQDLSSVVINRWKKILDVTWALPLMYHRPACACLYPGRTGVDVDSMRWAPPGVREVNQQVIEWCTFSTYFRPSGNLPLSTYLSLNHSIYLNILLFVCLAFYLLISHCICISQSIFIVFQSITLKRNENTTKLI